MKNLPNIDTLKQKFSGEVVLPGDSTYGLSRAKFATIPSAPALVLRPRDADDVVTAVMYARDNAFVVSIRSGGHSVAGFCTNTDGLVIDLSLMNQVEIIDETAHTVRIGAGATWGEIAKTLQEKHLALSSGDTKTVGVGGLTLGGGIGWMVRKYGLAIDSLVAAEIVTADGSILRVSATEHKDLFWAIRGGGGNFGVVNSFVFTAHPLGKVHSGSLFFTLDNLATLLKGWRDYMQTADEELTTILNIMPSFNGAPPALIMTCCYASDDATAAQKAIEPLKHLGTITKDDIKEKDYQDVLEDAHPPEGVTVIVKNVFAEQLSDDLIDTIVAAHAKNSNLILQIRGLNGAMNRVSADATAFPYRKSEVLLLSPTFVPATASEDDVLEALRPWETIAAFGKGVYVNFLSTMSDDDLAKTYPEATHKRLAAIKKDYDPQNIFNQNVNIKPLE